MISGFFGVEDAFKWTGKQITELDWYYYSFGLWHEDIDADKQSFALVHQICTVDANCFKDTKGDW